MGQREREPVQPDDDEVIVNTASEHMGQQGTHSSTSCLSPFPVVVVYRPFLYCCIINIIVLILLYFILLT